MKKTYEAPKLTEAIPVTEEILTLIKSDEGNLDDGAGAVIPFG